MNELKALLKKHGQMNKFGRMLLHRHHASKANGRIQKQDFHSLFLNSLLDNAYAVLGNAIEPKIARRLIVNYDKDIGYDPKARSIREDIGIGKRKTVIDPKFYMLPELMEGLYEITRPAAQIWASRMKCPVSYPRKYSDFQKNCATVGQTDPVVVFTYGRGSYVHFHSDPPGEVPFPFQFLGLLSDHKSFSGGDFLLRRFVKDTSSIIRFKLQRGDILIFPASEWKRSNTGGVEIWQHAVDELKSSKRFSISFLLNQAIAGVTAKTPRTPS